MAAETTVRLAAETTVRLAEVAEATVRLEAAAEATVRLAEAEVGAEVEAEARAEVAGAGAEAEDEAEDEAEGKAKASRMAAEVGLVEEVTGAAAARADTRGSGCITPNARKGPSCSTKALLVLRPGCGKSCERPGRCSVWRSACDRARAAPGSSTPGTRGRCRW